MKVMAHSAGGDELSAELALYALDLLPLEETSALSAHLAEGCTACEAELRELREAFGRLAAISAAQPPPALRERVLAGVRPQPFTDQVWKRWESGSAGDVVWRKAAQGPWQEVAPGVNARRLYVDSAGRSATMLVRMEPGSSYSAHRHSGTEQCFVLEGDIFDGEARYYAGDFQCKTQGSVHGVQSTEGGCLLLIVSSLDDELLP